MTQLAKFAMKPSKKENKETKEPEHVRYCDDDLCEICSNPLDDECVDCFNKVVGDLFYCDKCHGLVCGKCVVERGEGQTFCQFCE